MKRQTGLGKFEFAVVLAIFGVLAHILLDRLIALQHETERLEVSLTVRHINTGIKFAVAAFIIRGEETQIAALLEKSPLDFLGQTEKVGAGGTATAGTAANLGTAVTGWQYEMDNRTLRYHPRQPEAFYGESLGWRLHGQQDEIGRSVGLRLEPILIKPLK